jgi:hypothetical protein
VGLPNPLIGTTIDSNGDIQFGITEKPHGEADGGATVDAVVEFTSPPAALSPAAGIPIVNLAPTIGAGGTLAANQTLYYALSAVDANGLESTLSFIVRATIPAGGSSRSVTLTGMSFSLATSGFHVYRGASPAQMFRIASDQALSGQFTDPGLPKLVVAAPDPNYHHANSYWRLELQTEYAATIHTPLTVGNGTAQMTANAYRGMVARITRGKGAGQERVVASNTATVVTLVTAWDMEPDSTSFFVVAESAWRFGASGASSPVQFEIPNRTGAVVQISGRAANANDKESPAELATLTRWVIGGAGAGGFDSDVPPQPSFGLTLPPQGGVVEIGGISFPTLVNTRTVTAATVTVHYWDESNGQPQTKLATAITAADTSLTLTAAGGASAGSLVQIEREILKVTAVSAGGTQYQVERGQHGSTAASHAALTPIYELSTTVVVTPFARDFFGSPAGGNWSYPVFLPDVRVASAEMFVTNGLGKSPTDFLSVTQTVDSGLRTLSGGQFSITVEGFLAIENGVAPDLVVEAPHAVRDVYAVVRQAPSGAPVNVTVRANGSSYCTLSIPSGSTISNVVNGFPLAPLATGAKLNADITSVGTTVPGSDLTVIVRL